MINFPSWNLRMYTHGSPTIILYPLTHKKRIKFLILLSYVLVYTDFSLPTNHVLLPFHLEAF